MSREEKLRDEAVRAPGTVHCEVSEDALVRTDHLLQVGRFLAAFAHELNNCLHVINGLAELAQEAPGLPPTVAHKLHRIVEQSNRAGRGIREVVAFARERSTATSRVDLGALVESVLAERRDPLLRLGAHIELDRPTEQSLEVVGTPLELEQLVLALVLNAEEALARVATPRRLKVELSGGGDTVLLRVTDSGGGVDPSIRASMFEPFVSTRAHESAGLGLTAARAIAGRHGGHIMYQDGPGVGATFFVRLPAR
jgi:two-component system C4-dicarboxylate transport sensor histidine kinase DctB